MLNLFLATAFFLFTHVGIAGTGLRFTIVERVGDRAYIWFYSAISTLGVLWLFFAYLEAPYVELWGQLYGLRLLALIAMFLSFAFVVLGLTSKPQTLFGEAALAYRLEDVAGIARVTRHPIPVGLLLWSATHMIVNGDVAALLLFGSLTLLSALGIVSMDAKRARRLGADWPEFAAHTSVVPGLAIWQRRNRLVAAEIGWWRPAVIVIAFLSALLLHAPVIGVSPLPVF
jgi:uncharacterized membrane protein